MGSGRGCAADGDQQESRWHQILLAPPMHDTAGGVITSRDGEGQEPWRSRASGRGVGTGLRAWLRRGEIRCWRARSRERRASTCEWLDKLLHKVLTSAGASTPITFHPWRGSHKRNTQQSQAKYEVLRSGRLWGSQPRAAPDTQWANPKTSGAVSTQRHLVHARYRFPLPSDRSRVHRARSNPRDREPSRS